MLESISISNYALIDNIELEFAPGFNIITGETGAGKSIILGALSILLGSRADTRVVTDKEKKSVVEASFDIGRYDELKTLLKREEIDCDGDNLILRREINPAGRSRTFINDSPVALSQLRNVAIHLVDLHSQHQNLLLAEPDYQLSIIDSLLPDKSLLKNFRERFEEFAEALKKYRRFKKQTEKLQADREFMLFQFEKLDELNLTEGEQSSLENERETLANITEIKDSLFQLDAIFSADEDGLTERLQQASALADSLETIEEAAELSERIESLRLEAMDIADTISRLNSRIEANPARLEEIEQRLSEIYSLQRKHGVETVEDLIDIRDRLAANLEKIDNSDETLHNLARSARQAKNTAIEAAELLSGARKEVARQFAQELHREASPLGMKNLMVEIEVTPAELSAKGIDDVKFLFAFNKNQELMSVKDTASGGEISRLMLVVKSLLAKHMQLPTIIFDEIDTGVSGDIANKMGRLMQEISKHIQVIAITHLPQIAARGTLHHKVYKQDSATATNTHISTLSPTQRIDELALMLSGDASNEAARATAISLLQNKE